MRKYIKSKINDKYLNTLIDKCLESPSASEDLRRHLWFNYDFGDNVDQDPSLDGQNGLSQFCILASKLDIPIYRFFMDSGEIVEICSTVKDQKEKICPLRAPGASETHLLVVRFYRGNHYSMHIPPRRLRHNGVRYKLVSILMGSMHCGHQISAATRDLNWRRWAITDSDASRFGIGPVHFHNTQKHATNVEWWNDWRFMVPVTIFGSDEMCNLSPQNRPQKELESLQPKFRGADDSLGQLNADFVYISVF
jgi:hypothetical protein